MNKQKIFLSLGALSGMITYHYLKTREVPVETSWTLPNYEAQSLTRWDDNWDHRDPLYLINPKKLPKEPNEMRVNELLDKQRTKYSRNLILIRHGQYNLNGLTDNEKNLTELGRKQAEYTGKRLKQLPIKFDEMIKSTMTRAMETGSIITEIIPEVPVTECSLLIEGAPVPPEPPSGQWRAESYKYFKDGARIEAAFRKYFHRADSTQTKNTYTLLVCHANVIRYFVCRALQLPPEAWLRFSLNHASITWITIMPSGHVTLRTFGETGHMPISMITTR